MYQGESFEIEFKEVDESPRDFNDATEIIIAVRVNNVEKKVYKLSADPAEVEVDEDDSALVRVIGGLLADDTKTFPTGRMTVEMKAIFEDETIVTQFVEPVYASITTAYPVTPEP